MKVEKLTQNENPIKLAIFASGRGSNFVAIMNRAREGQLQGLEPALLITDKDCPALQSAKEFGLPHAYIRPKDYPNKTAYEQAILERLQEHQIQLIALAGYMRLIGPTLLEAYPDRILNLHPSLLPAYPGTESIRRAYEDKLKESGVTVHLVDAGLDSGPILAQAKVAIEEGMSLEEFEEEIHRKEHQLYPETLIKYARKIII